VRYYNKSAICNHFAACDERNSSRSTHHVCVWRVTLVILSYELAYPTPGLLGLGLGLGLEAKFSGLGLGLGLGLETSGLGLEALALALCFWPWPRSKPRPRSK